jgi:hypothetical protein
MTTITQMIRARGDGIAGLTAKGQTGYCFVARVGRAHSPYIQGLHSSGDLSC